MAARLRRPGSQAVGIDALTYLTSEHGQLLAHVEQWTQLGDRFLPPAYLRGSGRFEQPGGQGALAADRARGGDQLV